MKLILVLLFVLLSCFEKTHDKKNCLSESKRNYFQSLKNFRVIHVFVSLCDNKYQGIVKVPAKIGNGQDAANNLYWGCGYGVKTFFKNNLNWKLISSKKNYKEHILERCVFKHKTENVYLVADAYDGQYIKNCTTDFLKASAGIIRDSIIDTNTVFCGGSSQLICYVGHDGLMDFEINESYEKRDEKKRETIILACISKSYFWNHIKKTGAHPLLWSTGLMSPEAYTLEAAISGWINNEPDSNIRNRAAEAYHKYLKCGKKAALRLLVSGWK